jgi:RTX calcium-binding nonapeptide repeat (4 copies)
MRPCGPRRGPGRLPLIAVPALTAGLVLALTLLMSSPTAWAAQVAVVDQRLTFTGDDDVDDIVDIQPSGLAYEIYDARDEVTAGQGCVSLTLRLAYCTSFVLEIEAGGGGGDDLIGLWDVAVPVRANGGEGDDLLESGGGPDTLDGGEGTDGLVGGDAEDTLVGAEGDDLLSGQAAADTLQAGAGDDVVQGGDGSGDIALGGPDRDLVRGGPGQDRLEGDGGEDALIGGAGEDEVDGGPGADEVFGADGRRDAVSCGGRDRVRGEPRERGRCTGLLPQSRLPTEWPPRPPSAQATQFQHDPEVSAWPRRKGAARRTTVWVKSRWHETVGVRVRTLTKSGRPLRRFREVVHTKTADTFKRPRPGRAAWRVRARLP